MNDTDPHWRYFKSLFSKPSVDEILINGTRSLGIVAGGELNWGQSPFSSNRDMMVWLQGFARSQGVRLDPLNGAAGGQFQTDEASSSLSFRWHALLPPLSQDGPLFTMRRHRFIELTLEHFDGDQHVKAQLVASCRARRSLLIAGPTGSGKTSLMMALLTLMARDERVVIMESLAELPALFPGWIRLLERFDNLEGVGATSVERLFQEALRLRPDRLILGEIRGGEAQSFLQAMMSGHGGSMATIHGGSIDEAWERFVSLSRMEPSSSSVKKGHNGFPNYPLDVVMVARGVKPAIVGFRASPH